MPKTIEEAINFQENNDVDDSNMLTEPGMENSVPQEKNMPSVNNDSEMDVMAFIDDIRKKSLKGMAQLADNPDDERYQLLKKIWQICDKKPDQQSQMAINQHEKPQPNF